VHKLISIALFSAALGSPGLIQAAPPDEVDELKAQVEALKATVQRLEAKIDALASSRAAATPAPAPAIPTPAPAPPAPAQAPAAVPPAGAARSAALAAQAGASQTVIKDRDRISDEQRAAPRVDNELIDPELKGFFHFPGTDAIAKIDGYIKMDFIHDLKYAGDPSLFITSQIPVPPLGPQGQISNLQFKESTLNFELRRDTPHGNLRFVYENNFFGSNGSAGFNLRNAYGQLGNFLVGFSYTDFMDVDALADTLDFEGPGSSVFVNQAQFRVMKKLGDYQTVSASVEAPAGEVKFPVQIATPLSPWPDGVVNWRLEGDVGHLQVAALFRDISLNAANREASTFGWGTNVTGSITPFGNDNLVFQVAYGHGMSRYFEDTAGLGLDAAVNSNLQLVAIPAFGTYASYQHFWTKNLRSSLTYGYYKVQPTGIQSSDTFEISSYASGNLIWRPAGSMIVGAEYIYGWQQLQNGRRGIGSRIQVSAGYNPFRRTKPE